MLTREKLAPEEWRVMRDAPHLVMMAVSAAGGSPMDRMLERHAGMRSIVEASDSPHPLIRALADAPQIMEAQDDIYRWFYRLADAERTPEGLQERALQAMSQALDVVAEHGKGEDVLAYTEFALMLATRVARAAREGDVMGLGGKRVSAAEAAFIRRLEGIAATVVAA